MQCEWHAGRRQRPVARALPIGAVDERTLPGAARAANPPCSHPAAIQDTYIRSRLGVIPKLADKQFRAELAGDQEAFLTLLQKNIELNPANFESICFAVLRVHLEKFACKIYRDSRSAAHDKGVEFLINMKIQSISKADLVKLARQFDDEEDREKVLRIIYDEFRRE